MHYCDAIELKYNKSAPWPYNFEFRRKLPANLLRIFCACSSKTLLAHSDRASSRIDWDGYLKICTICKGATLDQLDICQGCGDRFVHDFSHPHYCHLKRLCLDCFQEVDYSDPCRNTIQTSPVRLESRFENFPFPKRMSMADIDKLLEGL